MQETADRTIHKSLTVGRRVEDAFALFTDGIGTWWPLETHSLGGERAETAVLEPRPGGRLYERTVEGGETDWGEVLVWEPPARVVLAWNLNGSEVEVRFLPDGDRTRVELEHRGWDRVEDPDACTSYRTGWDTVLGRYAEAASG